MEGDAGFLKMVRITEAPRLSGRCGFEPRPLHGGDQAEKRELAAWSPTPNIT